MVTRTEESKSDFRKNVYHKSLRNVSLKISVVLNLEKNIKSGSTNLDSHHV